MYCVKDNKLVKIIDYANDGKSYIVEDAFDYNNINICLYTDLIIYNNTDKLTCKMEEQLIGKHLYNIINY